MKPGEELNWDGIQLANNRKKSELELAGGNMAYNHSTKLAQPQTKARRAKKVGKVTKNKANIFLLKAMATITLGVAIFVPLHNANTELMLERGATKVDSYSSSGGSMSEYILPEGVERPSVIEIVDRAMENVGEKIGQMADRFGEPTIGNQIK